MSRREAPKVFSVPVGVPFLPTVARALLDGELVTGFPGGSEPTRLADATIYVPTRRAARTLRRVFMEAAGGRAAILPVIRPLGEFDEEAGLFEAAGDEALQHAPPISALDRLLLLSPLVRRWKRQLPAHVADLFSEEVAVPASTADSIWLARDLAALMDEVESETADWSRLASLVSGELAGWWQVTLDFLAIVTSAWPAILAELDRSNPAAHRDALIRGEAVRLARQPPRGPVIAAGSTGSVPATAVLLQAIASLPQGAVVLPGLDQALDEEAWAAVSEAGDASVLGHPQYGLAKLIGRLGVSRGDVVPLGRADETLQTRTRLVGAALRPAATTDRWASERAALPDRAVAAALAGITLVEAAHERDEALSIAIALRRATLEEDRTAALVTGDRDLARRVSAELARFGIRADDSGGSSLARSPAATLLTLAVEAALRPGDPVSLLSLLKHPLVRLGRARPAIRRAAGVVELVALRGGTGRPDVAQLTALFDRRLAALGADRHAPFWLARLDRASLAEARAAAAALGSALSPLIALREVDEVPLPQLARASVETLEALGREENDGLAAVYGGDAGEALAAFLRGLVAASAPMPVATAEWPDVLAALMAPETVKPTGGGDGRIAIWGQLEARLQAVDTLVLGGLNEGSWPRRTEADRFMSRLMKSGLSLEPPERRIGLAAHDFWMAMGNREVVLTRAARAGDAPAVASRWLQRLTTFAGPEQVAAMRGRGDALTALARALDRSATVRSIKRPDPKPPLDARPRRFTVTEIETLRRDPYAVYARRILGLWPLDGLSRDPGAAERGTLFHEILHRFSSSGIDVEAETAERALTAIAHQCFAEAALPADVHAVWWPRFLAMAGEIIRWEREDRVDILSRHPEARASPLPVGATKATLSGRADRIDLRPNGHADVLDFKTGSSPSKGQAHTLLAPQLALEAALLQRGAFGPLGPLTPAKLAFVRLRARGTVEEESILDFERRVKSAPALAEEAWRRLEQLLSHYERPGTGYLSRALPFREADMDGDYDHLARVLEWSAGAEDETEAEAGE